MRSPLSKQTGVIDENLSGIVDRVTFHNPENGWANLRVFPFNNPHQQETVIVHQTKVSLPVPPWNSGGHGATTDNRIPYFAVVLGNS